MIALTTMMLAALVEQHGWHPLAAIPLVLALGTLPSARRMGLLIQRFSLQPFIVTLAGMFLARGVCYLISVDSISIDDPFYAAMSQTPHSAGLRRPRVGRRGDRLAGGGCRHLGRALHRASAAPSTPSAAASSRPC